MNTIDTTKITNYVKWLIYINMAMITISAVSSFMQYNLAVNFENGIYTDEQILSLADANDQRESIIGIIAFLTYIMCIIFVARWIFVSSKHNHQTTAEDLKYTPGWSVGWYFVPVLSFWEPYKAFKQIYQVSVDPDNWKTVVVPSIMQAWWGLWLITKIIGYIYARFALRSSNLDSIRGIKDFSLFDMALTPLDLALHIVFLKIVLDISKRQNDYKA